MNMLNACFKIVWLFILTSFGMSVKCQTRNENYISCEFAYEYRERPVPRIVFYIDSVNRSDFNEPKFGFDFKVSEEKFRAIENVILNESSYIIMEPYAVRFYDINLFKDGKKTKYGTVNFNRSKEMFSHIIKLFENSAEYDNVLEAFNFAYKMIGIIRVCEQHK